MPLLLRGQSHFLLRKKQGGKYLSSRRSSDFYFVKTRRYVCRLILGGLAL